MKKTNQGVTQKTATIKRGDEIFVFENTNNLSTDDFGVACEEAIDSMIAARTKTKKYNALGAALLGQIERGEKTSDYAERKLEIIEFEKNNPSLSKGFGKTLNEGDGTNA